MGFLRYFLAMIVVMSHAPFTAAPRPLAGNGGLAVCAFFVISGFYMSLIVEKYQLHSLSYSSLKNFYVSRILRIYPVYFVCLIIVLLLHHYNVIALVHSPAVVLHSLSSLSDKMKYITENLFLIGQDWMRFYIYSPETKAFIFHPQTVGIQGNLLGSSFAIVGQAWSLALELMFYLLVPFLLTRRLQVIIFVCLASFGLRIVLMHAGDYYTLFATDIFFPVALGLFLLGSLSHRLIYMKLKPTRRVRLTAALLLCLTGLVVFFGNPDPALPMDAIDMKFWITWWAFILLVTVTVPYLFLFTKASKWDQYVGELSYPVYMTHLFCISLITKFSTSMYVPYYAIALSSGVSIVMIFLIARPIEYFRHTLYLKNKPLATNLAPDELHPVRSYQ